MTDAELFVAIFVILGRPYGWGGVDIVGAEDQWPLGQVTRSSDGIPVIDCGGLLILVSGVAWKFLDLQVLHDAGVADLNSTGLLNICDPVILKERDVASLRKLRPGDYVLYPGHVGIVAKALGEDDSRVMILEAAGGGRETHGKSPKACVRIMPIDYRSDRICVGRLKPEYRTDLYQAYLDNP